MNLEQSIHKLMVSYQDLFRLIIIACLIILAYHRKLSSFKEVCCSVGDVKGDNESISVDQLGLIHSTLLKCQELGDQKVELVGKIIDLLDNKTKQLILDTKTLGKIR